MIQFKADGTPVAVEDAWGLGLNALAALALECLDEGGDRVGWSDPRYDGSRAILIALLGEGALATGTSSRGA